MRSQTSSRKRGRETALSARSTRLKTGRQAVDYDDDHEVMDDSEVENDLLKEHHHGSPAKYGTQVRAAGQQQLAVQSPSPSPAKLKRVAANGFPVTVFPPAAVAAAAVDNNNSVSPPPSSGAAFQRQRSRATVASMKSNSSSSQATVHNNKTESTASAAAKEEAPPIRRADDEAAAMVAASIRRQQMKEAFQPWVMQTYGDAAKTKTISRRKSERIAKILRGEDRSNGADSSKFRFWVRAKGFRLGPPSSGGTSGGSTTSDVADDADDLYVVTSTTKDELGGEDRPVYKKVAVVEDFFDIIYREHVEFMNNSGGRPPTGKHAGQKRTYRAITEIYAFLPREAVTRFLMQCADCQRRGGTSSSASTTGGVVSPPLSTQLSPAPTLPLPLPLAPPSTTTNGVSPGSPTPPASPATNVKPHHPALLLPTPTPPQYQQPPMMLALSAHNIDLSLPLTSTLLKRATLAGVSHDKLLGLDRAESSFCSAGTSNSPLKGMTAGCKDEIKTNGSLNGRLNSAAESQVAAMAAAGLQPIRHDATSPITLDLSSTADAVMDDHSPGAIKDEDDDDDDEVEEKIETQDPERLKAFNMFVRLFVDENLDRMVPISRQPREKVQAIIDSCLRQFPEFGERARKRIRTYLKSCRRHKRGRDEPATAQGLVAVGATNRPMPPHLTSAVAEQILAQACENENQNAKRLRLGLEPISQPLPVNFERPCEIFPGSHSPAEAHSPATATSTANLFRPAFGPYQRTSTSSGTPASPGSHQGPTDLSTKSRTLPAPMTPSLNGLSGGSSRASPLPHKLSAAEMLAVRQLVAGYRESAAFLLRSADELEQLLLQQNVSL